MCVCVCMCAQAKNHLLSNLFAFFSAFHPWGMGSQLLILFEFHKHRCMLHLMCSDAAVSSASTPLLGTWQVSPVF